MAATSLLFLTMQLLCCSAASKYKPPYQRASAPGVENGSLL